MNRIAVLSLAALAAVSLVLRPSAGRASLWNGPDVTYDGDRPVTALDNAGDVNGDGYQDLLYGTLDRVNVCYGPVDGADLADPDLVLTTVAGESFGTAAATAGDVNGDGYDDVIVGAPGHDEPYQPDTGWFAVYPGTAGGLDTTPLLAVNGSSGDRLGGRVGYAGDVNGDGYDDVFVLRFGDNTLFVHLGGPAGPSATPDWSHTFSGVARAAPAGDVNGDGYDDLIVGDALAGSDGYAYIYLGTSGGLRTTASVTLYGDANAATFGDRVFGVGDVNGDGYADVAVADPFADNGGVSDAGCVSVFLGGSDLPSTPADWTARGQVQGQLFGRGLVTAGDVNGDGYADLLAGGAAVYLSESRCYLGSADGLATSPSDVLPQAEYVCAADLNGDGFSDLFLAGGSTADTFYGYHGHGADPATLADWQLVGPAGAEAGKSLALGDLNGDGYSDLAVGLPGYDGDRGRVQIYYGSRYGLFDPTADRTLYGAAAGDCFGAALAAGGDLNGDGYGDLAIGIPCHDGDASNTGQVRVFYGSPAGIGYTADVVLDGPAGQFGSSLSCGGDADGDGYADLLVGAPFVVVYTGGIPRFSAGQALLFRGGAGGLATTAAWTYTAGVTNAKTGASVALAGDVNRDGYTDLLVGVPGENGGDGRVCCFLGGTGGAASAPAWTRDGVSGSLEALGTCVAAAGDVNGDGYADIALGIRNAGGGQGRVEVFLGSTTGPGSLPGSTFTGASAGDYAGWAVAALGDVDGDGCGELAVGVPGVDRVDVHFGGSSGLVAGADWSVARSAGSSFGIALGALGDTDGDGFPDLLVGAPGADVGGTDTGEVFCFPGNGREPVTANPVLPRQLRTAAEVPIAPGGASDSPASFRIRLRARSAAGRHTLRLQTRHAPWGGDLDGTTVATGLPFDTGTPGSDGSAVEATATIGGLVGNTPYQWQARLVGRSPYFRTGPWVTIPGTARGLCAVRTQGSPALPNLVVAGIAPVATHDGVPLTLRITVANTGTAAADTSSTRVILDGSVVCAGLATPALPAGGSAILSCEAGWTAAGSHTVTACADAAGSIDESDEGDNCLAGNVALTAHPLVTVASDGSGDVPTIADALTLVSPAGTVELQDGVFTGAGNCDLTLSGKTVTLRAAGGDAGACVIDVQGSAADPHHGLVLTGGAVLHLQDLTIRGGYAVNGTAVSANGAWLYAARCVFRGGYATNAGGAVNLLNGGGRFDDCRFEDNHAVWGGGALYLNDAGPVVDACLFAGNTCDHWGGAVHGQNAASVFSLASCTFSGNGADQGSAVYVRGGSAVTIGNSILAFGTGGEPVWNNGGEIAGVICCDVYGNAGGDFVGALAGWDDPQEDNFAADPLFCDAAGGDYRVAAESPCAEANNPACGQVGAFREGCSVTDVAEAGIPAAVFLAGGVPNPFNPATDLAFGLPAAAPVTLTVHDLAGRRIRTLLAGRRLPAGRHGVRWDGRDDAGRVVAAGVYLVRLQAGDVRRLGKVALVK